MTHHATEKICSAAGFLLSFIATLWENGILIDLLEFMKEISRHFFMGAVGGLGAWLLVRWLNKRFPKR
jgi:predicted PurR-regulated permease PerM